MKQNESMETCAWCKGTMSMDLATAYQKAMEEATSRHKTVFIIVECRHCGGILGQFGYCVECDFFTAYMSLNRLDSNKAICSKCSQLTSTESPPAIMSI